MRKKESISISNKQCGLKRGGMTVYSEQELKHAAEFRNEIHKAALEKVRARFPDAGSVVDQYPVEAYFQEVWDYPGKWYRVVGIPEGAGSRNNLIDTIVRNTLEHYRNTGKESEAESFYKLIAEYPDIVCDYCIVTKAEEVFPYRGVESHRLALGSAALKLFDGGREWSYNLSHARSKKLKSKALFAPAGSDEWLNYRKAFLCPPHGTTYTDADFERVNNVLFPGGTDELEVYRWTTDWSEYFDDGHEWWGTLCLTVYDKSLDRFVVIMASAND